MKDSTNQKSGVKTCNICFIDKNKSEFYNHPTHPDHLTYKCKECSRRLNKENRNKKIDLIRAKARYRYANDIKYKSEILIYQKLYRIKNKEKCLEYAKNYRSVNKDITNAKISAYRRTPKERFKDRQKQLRRLKMLKGKFTYEEWKELCNKYDNKCLKCGTHANKCEITIDHVIPIIKGGTNTIDNIQPLCRSCNSSKQAKILDFRL